MRHLFTEYGGFNNRLHVQANSDFNLRPFLTGMQVAQLTLHIADCGGGDPVRCRLLGQRRSDNSVKPPSSFHTTIIAKRSMESYSPTSKTVNSSSRRNASIFDGTTFQKHKTRATLEPVVAKGNLADDIFYISASPSSLLKDSSLRVAVQRGCINAT